MIYVDKTNFIHQLVSEGRYYFLARPRRFGKSLLLTTLKSYFQGKKELFEGLFIAEKEKEWKKYPVIHIDYSLVEYRKNRATFELSLMSHIKSIARAHGIELTEAVIGNAFTELIQKLYEKKGKVVVLVDEYDKPMVDTLTKPERFAENREILSQLYGAMKGLDEYFRFVMLTGVSRFSKVNVFSGMNNLDDISMSPEYTTVAGFTLEEVKQYFTPHLEAVRQRFNAPEDYFMKTVQENYNGFSWDGEQKLYNPFSLFKFLKDKEFGNYWFSSGTPTFLIELIRKKQFIPEELEHARATDLEGATRNIQNLPVIPLLFQTGYLTIQKVEYENFKRIFHLNYPNEEVRSSFIRYLAAGFVGKEQHELQPEALDLRDALRGERLEDFITILQSFLADIPARLHIPKEAYYHSLVYMMLRLVGVQLLLEKETSKGRIDAVLEFPDKIYIIEFKFGHANSRIKNIKTLAKKAIEQIKAQKYADPHLNSGKRVLLFGVGFLDRELFGKSVELPSTTAS